MSSLAKNQRNLKENAQVLSLLFFPYIRVLTDYAERLEVEKLKKKFWYISIYSYSKLSLPSFHQREQTTIIIDLTQSPDEIFKNFRKNTRNEIRKTEEISVLQFSIPDTNDRESYSFYKKVKSEDGVNPDIRKDFDKCLLFNAYLKGSLIVSVSCWGSGDTLRLKHIVSSRKEGDYISKLAGHATRRIIWEICKYGKKHGYGKLDLAGANLTDPKKAGITKFKQSFGGNVRKIYIYKYERKLFKILKDVLHIFGKNIN